MEPTSVAQKERVQLMYLDYVARRCIGDPRLIDTLLKAQFLTRWGVEGLWLLHECFRWAEKNPPQ